MTIAQFLTLITCLFLTIRIAGGIRFGTPSYLMTGLWAVNVAVLVLLFLGLKGW